HSRLANLHGPAATWKVIRLDLVGCDSVRDLVARTNRSFFDVAELGVLPDFFDVVPHTLRRMVFNYLPPSPTVDSTPIEGLTIHVKRRAFRKWLRPWDLHLTMKDMDDRSLVFWTGNEALFSRAKVEALLEEYFDILARAREG